MNEEYWYLFYIIQLLLGLFLKSSESYLMFLFEIIYQHLFGIV